METLMWLGLAALVAALAWRTAPYHGRPVDQGPIVPHGEQIWD